MKISEAFRPDFSLFLSLAQHSRRSLTVFSCQQADPLEAERHLSVAFVFLPFFRF